MVMDMSTICMSCNDKRISSFGKTKCELMAKFVGFFRSKLTGFKGLTDLVCDHIVLIGPSGLLIIQAFLQHKLFINCHRITAVPGDKFTFLCFIRILGIVSSVI